MNKICKICNRDSFSEFIKFEKYPKTISFLFNDKSKSIADSSPILFIQCNYCQHIQIANDMPQSFYEEYVMTVSHSQKMVTFQNMQAKQFINKFNLKGKEIFEAGCGDGNFLNILRSEGCLVYGNEPSKSFRLLATEKQLIVDDQYINSDYHNSHAPFDAIVSREVLEHVPEPINFLHNLKNLLKENGVILIEVPNFEKSLKENRYYDMFPDHLSYFTSDTLTAAMLLSGFKNIEIYYGMDDEFIYAFAENKITNNEDLIKSFSIIHSDFMKLSELYKNIVVWGAGGKGISALGSLNIIKNIKYVVDSDILKQDKFLPSSGLSVKSPEFLFQDDVVDLLIITNLAYTDEILDILSNNNFSQKVMLLSKNGIVESVN